MAVDFKMNDLLTKMVQSNGSDLILSVGLPPMMRVDGKLKKINQTVLTKIDTMKLIYSCLTEAQRKRFEQTRELDCSYEIPNVSRFRVNVYSQKGNVGCAYRAISSKIPSMEDLKLPMAVYSLARLDRGLVLVTGPTGSGKSTTLAAMINLINTERSCHIVTIEDPIEYVHEHKQCIVDQRELKSDTASFTVALKHVLRQDPDVILVGEMRDLETIAASITLAETGHLVLSTLHTQDAAQTVDRIVDVFPPYQQQQIRMQLSVGLKGVISQQLLPLQNQPGRIAAREIMIVNAAIGNLIREGKSHQIYSAIQTSAKLGMQTLDQDLFNLNKRGKISVDDALSKASDPKTLSQQLMRSGSGGLAKKKKLF